MQNLSSSGQVGLSYQDRPLRQNYRVRDFCGLLESRPRARIVGMKMAIRSVAVLILGGVTTSVWAADVESTAGWHAQTIWEALFYMLIFAAVGIGAAITGYKLIDWCTPGNLSKEILENKNVAAAIVAGAMILGICIIVAAAMMG